MNLRELRSRKNACCSAVTAPPQDFLHYLTQFLILFLMGKFDRNSTNSGELARRLRPWILSVVSGECFAQTSAFSRGRHVGQAGQNYHIAFA
jgi:hypothetical protein